MMGRIFITSSGYDPELGKHVKDPYLGDNPSLGACRPDIRKAVSVGDHIFTISGKVRGVDQFVMGGFEVAEKIHMKEAYRRFPEQRLHRLKDGQLDGNVILDSRGRQHRLDTHDGFDRRIKNYVIGTNALVLSAPAEIERGRRETLEVLCDVVGKGGRSPKEVVGRWGCRLDEEQVLALRAWLQSVKAA